jgi:4-hydroxybenzoate polyprenyltransferase
LIHYIFLTRPHLFIPTLIFYFNGLFLGGKKVNYIEILGLISISAFAYVLNQIFDINTDRLNNKVLILTINKISLKGTYIFCAFLLLLSILFSVLQNNKILFFILLILSVLYSLHPFKFKDRPFLDLISNSIGYGFLVFSIGYNKISLISMIFVIMMASAYMMTAILDYEGDKKAGKTTTVVFCGIKRSLIITTILLIVDFLISFKFQYIQLSVLISIFFLLLKNIKYALAFPSLILLIYPSLNGYFEVIVLSLILFLSSEIYYRLTFKRSHFY